MIKVFSAKFVPDSNCDFSVPYGNLEGTSIYDQYRLEYIKNRQRIRMLYFQLIEGFDGVVNDYN